jgi:hypothetical protein
VTTVAALNIEAGGENALSVTAFGKGSIEFGQVVRGADRSSVDDSLSVSHVWQHRTYVQLGARALTESKRAGAVISAEGLVTYSWMKQQEIWETLRPKYTFYPDHVEGFYRLGDVDRPYLEIGAGLFPYKYNPDVRNLGEYLFRTGTYPQVIYAEFDFPLDRLMGLRLSSTLLDERLHQDLLITSEDERLPLLDWAISYIADFSALPFLNIGAGVSFSHLLSVNEEYTTPRVGENIAEIDTAADDTLYYTFRGSKVMARFALDIKRIFMPGDDYGIFGPNDLRLYAEWAIIGLKNYPGYYEHIAQRMPVVLGLNIPAFRVLDVAAVEVEYFSNPYPNNYYKVITTRNIPIPYTEPRAKDVLNYSLDNVKWSVYLTKTIAGCLHVTGQVANDHLRMVRHHDRETDREEVTRGLTDWHYLLKLGFSF